MELKHHLVCGKINKFYNSLLIDVRLEDGTIVPAFCSSMKVKSLCKPETVVYLKQHQAPRIVRNELEFISHKNERILANISYNRQLFKEAFEKGIISELQEYNTCREIENGDSLTHIDFEVSGENHQKCVVFIENIYNKSGNFSLFPESINFFEMEMFEKLSYLRSHGYRTMIFMIVPRSDCLEAKFSWTLNPIAAAKMYDEAKKGLEFVCYACNVEKNNVSISKPMNILYK